MNKSKLVEVGPLVHLHVVDWGKGEPVVFIRGFSTTEAPFEHQFCHLPQNRYRCVGITMRGFGQSSKPWDEYSLDIFADDINRVLATLDLRDVTLAGYSLGGAIAIHYLARHSAERTARLALFKTPPAEKPATASLDLEDFIEGCRADRLRLIKNFSGLFFHAQNLDDSAVNEWLYSIDAEASPNAMAACLIALREDKMREALALLKVPVMIFNAVPNNMFFAGWLNNCLCPPQEQVPHFPECFG